MQSLESNSHLFLCDELSKTKGDRRNNRVVRGGSWNNNPNNVRAANRNNNNPENRNNNIGFRLVNTFPAGVFSFTEEKSEH
ncbi:MAG: SUMF1/EgtB/PvdO family nonheme iron enzyme [Deferribacteres bacterium]|nr:SUMF1/EgtB/PvdO family nonheme iron enzyme [Deferribacteres bacterium]